jgi:glycosyltransferase involved in cell wall biosynthesis
MPKLKSLANRLGLNGNVRFLGFVPAGDMPALYSQARAFIFPSLVETFGKPLVEAMQCGAPVVASNTSCMPEVLGGAGLLVNPLDASEMAAAISQASQEGAFRDALVARSLARGRQFSSMQVALETISVIEGAYQQHLARRGARVR